MKEGIGMEDQVESFVLVDDEGTEHEFFLIDGIEVDGAEYAILEPVAEENDAEEPDAVILKIGKYEQGEDILFDIEDDDEWEKVADAWQELLEDNDEETDS
jgi:uncharacterized protein YrzB (UPF0473 family)